VRRRLDAELVRRGLVASRARAVEVIDAGLVTVGSAPATTASRQVAPAESACTALRQLQVPGAALSELKTEWFAAGSPLPPEPPWMAPLTVRMPAYCRLDATLDRRTGADGKSYGIGFALALPAEWNGRFLFQGGGGLNGSVAPPLGRTGEGDAALARGFAVVTTDTGHRGEVFDASFMAEQQASLDFAYQAVGRTTPSVPMSRLLGRKLAARLQTALAYLPYAFGSNLIEQVMIGGEFI